MRGRPPTGSPKWDDELACWTARIPRAGANAGDRRRPVKLEGIGRDEVELAKEAARIAFERARDEVAAVDASTNGESVADWWTRYHEAAARGEVGRRNRGRPQAAIAARRIRFAKHIAPAFVGLSMRDVTSDHVHALVVRLNAKIRERQKFYALPATKRDAHEGPKPGMTPKSAAHVWSELRSGFRTACTRGNVASLRVRDGNPTVDVEPPLRDEEREQAALYPSELVAWLSCEDVPAWRRILYAVAAYTGIREGELRALRVGNVDLEHRIIRVSAQKRKNKDANKRAKTDAATRDVPIVATLVPLLEQLVDDRDDAEPLLRVPPAEDCARLVRDDLGAAKVTRAELFEDSERVMPFTFHGLRHTCLTHWAMTPGASMWSLAAAGHTTAKTAERYIARANLVRAGRFGAPHPTLPAALVKLAANFGSNFGKSETRIAKPAAFSVRRSDPNGNRTHVTGVRGRCPNR